MYAVAVKTSNEPYLTSNSTFICQPSGKIPTLFCCGNTVITICTGMPNDAKVGLVNCTLQIRFTSNKLEHILNGSCYFNLLLSPLQFHLEGFSLYVLVHTTNVQTLFYINTKQMSCMYPVKTIFFNPCSFFGLY